MTTATLSQRFVLPWRGSAPRRGFLLGFGGTLLVALVLLVSISVAVALSTGSAVVSRVSIAGLQLGGLEGGAVEERLRAGLPSLAEGRATLVVDGREHSVGYGDVGRDYELGAMVDAALAVGRGNGLVEDGLARIRSLVADIQLPLLVRSHEPAALDRAVARTTTAFHAAPVDAAVERNGAAFMLTPAKPGTRVAPDDVRAALLAVLETADPADATITLEPTIVEPRVSTADAQVAADRAAAAVQGGLSLELPGSGADADETFAFDAATLAGWISFGASFERPYDIRIGDASIWSAIGGMRADIEREAHNASFSLAGMGLGGVVAGQEGRELDVFASTQRIVDALRDRAAGGLLPSVPLIVEVIDPELTTAEAEEAFAQMELVSSWTTYYTPNDGNGFGANINIGAFDIDGQVLLPGEWFSFWNSIGPVTVERGYHYGGVIIGGRSVAGGAIGGGICSTSTTIFNAALRAGLEMGDRANHYYYIDRYPDGLDATVIIVDDQVQDMTFRNDTESPIVIRGFGGNGFVRFDLWMVPSGRKVVLTDPFVTNRTAAIETTQVDPSMRPGTSRRIEYPHHGHDVSVTRFVYDSAGELVHENRYFSSYRAVNGVTLVGPAAQSKPKPPPDDPPDEDDEEDAA